MSCIIVQKKMQNMGKIYSVVITSTVIIIQVKISKWPCFRGLIVYEWEIRNRKTVPVQFLKTAKAMLIP